MAITEGGPAFPTDEYYDEKRRGCAPGMTLRDYFAAAALTGLMGDPGMRPADEREFAHMATRLYQLADAMVAAREAK